MNDDEYGSKEAPVSLSGNLEVFPLEEVLRLLSRSRQTGRLRVDGPGAGSVYLEEGAITFAAEGPDEMFRRVLLAGGVVTAEGLDQLDLSKGSLTEVLAPDVSSSTLDDLVREQCVESLYRIRRPGHGPFTFSVDVRPRYVTGQRYDIEVIVSEADRRASEWAEIEEVVPDLSTPWRMVREIGDDSVTISDVAWRFLSALEGSASVEAVGDRLGLTSFQAARRMAELGRARLVEAVEVAAPVDTTPQAAFTTPQPPPEPAFVGEPKTEPVYEPDLGTEPEPSVDRSWWEEETPSFQPGEFGDSPLVGEPHDDEPVADEDSPDAPDESFLEGVFGGITEDSSDDSSRDDESDDDDDDDDEHGFGLLRRRGLGAAFRELADG